MSKYHCNGFEMIHWMSWKRLLKDVVQDETFQFQDELRSFILLSLLFHWFFFGGSLVVPLWFPVVFPHCAYCREGPWGILRPETLETVKISKVSGRKLSSNYDLKIISKLTDFLLLCVLKSAYFFIAKGPPHKWWRSMVSNANLDFG